MTMQAPTRPRPVTVVANQQIQVTINVWNSLRSAAQYAYQLAWKNPTITSRASVGLSEHFTNSNLANLATLAAGNDAGAIWRYLAVEMGDEYAALSYDSAMGLGATGAYVDNMFESYGRSQGMSSAQIGQLKSTFALRQAKGYAEDTIANGKLLNEQQIAGVYDRTVLELQAYYITDNTVTAGGAGRPDRGA